MRPTRLSTLVVLLVVAAVGGYALAATSYGSLTALPAAAPVTAAVIAVFELGLARVVSRKVNAPPGRGVGRPMHPLQVARAVALAKASSPAGALLGGFYGGFFLWVVRRTDLRAARHDAWVSGLSALACLVLVVAALLLERACRVPPGDPEAPEAAA